MKRKAEGKGELRETAESWGLNIDDPQGQSGINTSWKFCHAGVRPTTACAEWRLCSSYNSCKGKSTPGEWQSHQTHPTSGYLHNPFGFRHSYWPQRRTYVSLVFLVGFGSPPRCPHVGRALCPKGLLSALALASLVTQRVIHLRFFWGGLFLLASLGMIPRCCFVLYSLSFAAGFFLLPRRFFPA